MSNAIRVGNKIAILPDSPTAEDYVLKVERRLEREKAGGEPTLSRCLCDVAHEVVQDERDAGNLDYPTWKTLNDRIRDVQEWLIDHDRYE